MQSARRRPLGDIGNTFNAANADNKPRMSEGKPRFHCEDASPKVDSKFGHNPLYVAEYAKDIHENHRRAELKGRPSATYMTVMQTEITEKMRTILVDWFVDVHLKFKLQAETLFLAVEIVDRFLEKKVVSRQKLQLVGVAAMLLASKYEEIYPPEVKDFVYIAANTYTRDDILRMERLIFQTLDFNLTMPTLFTFVRRALQVIEADTRTQHMAQFLAELSLLDFKMLSYHPSMIASSCVYVANKFFGREPWNRILEHYMSFKVGDLEPCCVDLLAYLRNSVTQKTQAVRRKFSYAKYSEVAKLTQGADLQFP